MQAYESVRMPTLIRLLVLLPATAALACGGPRPRPHSAVSASDAVLTEAEIAESSARNAYDAVQFLCPPRVRSSVNQRSIFLDGIQVRGPRVLQDVPTEVIHEIRWLEARDAVIRYGSAHADGIILILTKPAS